MWFAYMDNSISWYDLDAKDVRQQLANNKKGIKAPPLEDLVKHETVLAKSVDLIQENNVDRFEKKKQGNRKKPFRNKQDESKKPEQANRKPEQNSQKQNLAKNQNKDKNAPVNKGKNTGKSNFRKNTPKTNNNE